MRALLDAAAGILGIAGGYGIRYLQKKRALDCFHHHPQGGWVVDQENKATSHVTAMLIETGMRKMFWCTRCQHDWFT